MLGRSAGAFQAASWRRLPAHLPRPLGDALLDARRHDLGVLVELLLGHGPLAEMGGDVHLVAHLHPVAPLELDGVEVEGPGDVLHVGLEGELGLGRAVAPVGARHRDVGVDDVAVEALGRRVVGGEAPQPRHDLHGEAVGAVGAGVADDAHVLGQQGAVVVHRGAEGDGLGVAGAAGVELLGPVELEAHRAAGGDGEVGDDVLDQHLLLGPEAAADAGLDHPDVLDVHADERGQHPAGVERHLGGGAHHHALVGVEPGHRDVGLDGALLHLVDPERLLEDVGRGRQVAVHVAPSGLDVVHEVALGVADVGGVVLVVDLGGVGVHGVALVVDRGQDLVFDLDEPHGLLGRLDGLGGHRGHPVADVADPVVEAHLVVGVGVGPALAAGGVLDPGGVAVVQHRVDSGDGPGLAESSMLRMRAWAWGLRSTLA